MRKTKQEENLSVHNMLDVPVQRFWIYRSQKLASRKSECYAIKNKYQEAASAVQVYSVLNDIENLAGCTPAKVGGSSEWNSNINSAEGNRANFCKFLSRKPLFSSLYSINTVTLN